MIRQNFQETEYTKVSDDILIDRTLQGDHQAFGWLFARHHKSLYHSMLKIAKSADIAEELVQDSFVQAFVKLASFKREAKFSSWIFRIAINKYLGMKRTHRTSTSLDTLVENSHQHPVDPHDSPEKSYARCEDRLQVAQALKQLDTKARRILLLREMKGLSYDEIGQKLCLKPGTVRSQLSRARWKLHKELTHPYVSTEPTESVRTTSAAVSEPSLQL